MLMETLTPNSSMLPTLITTSSIDPMIIGSLNTTTNHAESFNHNSIVIWFYDEHLAIDVQRAIRIKLIHTFKCVRFFTDKKAFLAYLNRKLIVPISIFIISGEQAEELCRVVKEKSRKYDVYELNINLTQSVKKSSNTWFTFNNIKELFETISVDLKKRHVTVDNNGDTSDDEVYRTFLPPLGIFNSFSIPKLFFSLDKESSTFLLFQLLNKIIIQMKYTSEDLDIMCAFCRQKYQNDDAQRLKIDDFKDSYSSDNAIWHYTKDFFLWRSLNEVLRREDTNDIYKFRCYIADLHKQLKQKYTSSNNKITVYRGKKLPLIVLQQLKELYKSKNVTDKRISINGFLSTTKKKKIAKIYAGIGGTIDGYESVMFRMHIDRAITTTVPYTYIADADTMFPEEREILFSMGSVWQLTSVKRNKAAVWTIVLRLCDSFDDQLPEADEQLLVDPSSNDYHVFLLARVLHELGKYSEAGEFYHHLLEKQLSDKFQCLIHCSFAAMRSEQGEYTDAQKLLEKILAPNKSDMVAIDKTNSVPLRPIYAITAIPSQMTILNNMGVLHQKKNDYHKARNSFKEALEKQGSVIEEAMVHNNLGNLENFSGNIKEAHQHLIDAVKLAENSVWSNKFKKDLENVQRLAEQKKSKQHN